MFSVMDGCAPAQKGHEFNMTTKIIAHRGLSSQYPENTMLAFQKAVEIGCDGIELDVQLTSDGVPVIIHDENLRRVTGRPGLVKDFTYRELKLFDAGHGFDARLGITPIPTLKEYFAFIRDYDIVTDIELKNSIFRYEGMEQTVTALIKKFKIEDKIFFSSFNHQSLAVCKKLLPSVPCGLLTNCWLAGAGAYAEQCGAEYINPHYTFITPENIRELEENKIGAFVWTVDDRDEMLRLASLGVAGIITNCPEKFSDVKRVKL